MAPVPPSILQLQQPGRALGHKLNATQVVVDVVFGGLWSNHPHHQTTA